MLANGYEVQLSGMIIHARGLLQGTLGATDDKDDQLQEHWVGKQQVEKTDVYKYLGVFITSDGQMDVTINKRLTNGHINARLINSKLTSLKLGSHQIETGLLFRTSVLLSSLLNSFEVCPNLSEKQVRKLEQLDENF